MHQTVLVHTEVHKGAKLRHVAHGAFQNHAFLEVLDVFHAIVKAGHNKVRAWVTAGLFQLTQNVLDRDGAELLVGKQLWLQGLEHFGTAHDLVHRLAGGHNDLLHHGVGFRVNAGHIQWVVPPANAQKACSLLKRLGAQARDFHKLLAVAERTIRITPAHHRLGHRAAQARHAGEQRHGSRVQVYAHGVHAVFHHRIQLACQLALVDIVLVLAHANALGVNLDQLCQWVLQAAGNRDRTAQAHIHIRQLLRGKFAGRVDRCPGFAHHHFFQLLVHLGSQLEQVSGQLVGFAAGRAVANGNQVHAMLFHQTGQHRQRAIPVLAGLVGVDRGGIHQLAGAVHHSHFHAGADSGVQTHHGTRTSRCGQQQVAQVVAKHLDGHLLGIFTQAAEQVTLRREAELDAPGPGNAFANQIVCGALGVAPAQMQGNTAFGQAGLTHHRFFRLRQLDFQNLLRTATEHSQRPVRWHAADGFFVIKIVAEL